MGLGAAAWGELRFLVPRAFIGLTKHGEKDPKLELHRAEVKQRNRHYMLKPLFIQKARKV